jgi:hypothetical protein
MIGWRERGPRLFAVAPIVDPMAPIQDYAYAIKQLALTALRDVVGGATLEELLAERDAASYLAVDRRTRPLGIEHCCPCRVIPHNGKVAAVVS